MAADGASSTNERIEPVIEELVRTRYCRHSLNLLVDKITIVTAGRLSHDEDAYRLWLGDGTKVIQAVLTHDLHPFLNAGKVRQGSIVTLTTYQLVRATRRNQKGWVWIIAIHDMDVIGHDGRQATDVEIETPGEIRVLSKETRPEKRASSSPGSDISNKKRTAPEPQRSSPGKRKRTGVQFFSSPLKPKPRLALGETSTNSIPRTPTKATKVHTSKSASPPRALLCDELIGYDGD